MKTTNQKLETRTLEEIHSLYDDYREYMLSHGTSNYFHFEDWIKHSLSVGKITEKEFKKCYTYDGYLIEPKLWVD